MAHVRVVVGVAAMPILLLAGAGNTGAAATSPSLRFVDDTHTITVDVPAAWTDVDTSAVSNPNGTLSAAIFASTDLVTFRTPAMRSVPGVFFIALPGRDDAGCAGCAGRRGLLGAGVMPYADGVFVGHAQALGCGPTEARQLVVAATRLDRAFTGYLEIQLVDWEVSHRRQSSSDR